MVRVPTFSWKTGKRRWTLHSRDPRREHPARRGRSCCAAC